MHERPHAAQDETEQYETTRSPEDADTNLPVQSSEDYAFSEMMDFAIWSSRALDEGECEVVTRAIMLYLSDHFTTPSGEHGEELVDTDTARRVLGYKTLGAVRYAVKTGKLVPAEETLAPDGRVLYRQFRLSDVQRLAEALEDSR